jgi:hypothetical protein
LLLAKNLTLSNFTHQENETHFKATLYADAKCPYDEKRSAIQVAELVVNIGIPELKGRKKPYNFYLPDLKE